MDEFLTVSGLEYYALNGDCLLRNLSFELPKGARLAIAGPNGAGKTTLLNLLSGVEDIALGEITIDGQGLRRMPVSQRARRIALVSQHAAPDGRLKLRDYVALGQMPIWADYSSAEHGAALDRILALTGLTPLAGSPMERLSGGERQRAHIARALAQKPQILFLDEPTNHLDPDAKGRMLSLVAALGVTVIMVVHDLVMIPEFATHIALMKDTRLTGFGPVADVLTPEAVKDTFGVDYLLLPHGDRQIPVLDIRKTDIHI
ncbi:MAG: ABC transporter ATP-binding protein [Pelagimonas sp.]|nr:ABC transporter ATP-binding protein [Pelagimonas sp.]